jgi:hypothetical protein
VLQDECLPPFYLSLTQNILPFTKLVLKLVVCVQCMLQIGHTIHDGHQLIREGDVVVCTHGDSNNPAFIIFISAPGSTCVMKVIVANTKAVPA